MQIFVGCNSITQVGIIRESPFDTESATKAAHAFSPSIAMHVDGALIKQRFGGGTKACFAMQTQINLANCTLEIVREWAAHCCRRVTCDAADDQSAAALSTIDGSQRTKL